MTSRSQWDETIKAVQGMGYPQNPAAPPAPKPNSFGDAAAVMGNPGTVQPRSTFGSMAAQAAQAQPGGARPPAPPSFGYQDNNESVGRDIKDAWGRGNYGEAAGKTVAGTVGFFTTPGIDLAVRGGGAALQGVGNFARGVFGMDAAPAQSGAATAAPKPPATTYTNPADQRLAAGTQAAPMGLAAAALASSPAASPATPANQVMPGVFNHGRGQYSDQAGGMGMPSSFTGQPNQQNLNAAQRLSDSQSLAARAMQQQAQQPGFSGVIGQQGGNGNMWSRTPEQQRRDAEVQASSIHRPTAARGFNTLKALDAESLEGVRGANALAQEAMRGQSGLAQEALRQDGGLQREGMQQGGANQRSMMTAMLEQQKINQAGETAGYSNRAAAQTEALRNTLLNPESTPEQRKQAQSALMALQGKDARGEWGLQVTPSTKNMDGSTTQGSVYRYNRATGEVERVDGSPNNVAPYADGQELRGKDGKIYVVRNGQPALK